MDDFQRELLARLPLAKGVFELFSYVLSPPFLDDLFEEHRGRCYERELSFGQVVYLPDQVFGLGQHLACQPTGTRRAFGRVVAGDGTSRWHPESGQTLLEFGGEGSEAPVEPLSREATTPARRDGLSAEDWYERAVDLEAGEPGRAQEAYEAALRLEPSHGAARVNLGRLLHERGDAVAGAGGDREVLGQVELGGLHELLGDHVTVDLVDLVEHQQRARGHLAGDPLVAPAHPGRRVDHEHHDVDVARGVLGGVVEPLP